MSNYVTANLENIRAALSRAGLTTINEGFGRNIQGRTLQQQYIIYLHPTHIDDNLAALKEAIETAVPDLAISIIKPVTYQSHNQFHSELWCYCAPRLKSR